LSYDKNGKYSATNIAERFGSWNDAVKEAGLQIFKISDEALFENIASVWQRLGRQPVGDEMGKEMGNGSAFPYATYRYRFGSWNNALECFIQFINAKDLPEPVAIDTTEEQIRGNSKSPPKEEILKVEAKKPQGAPPRTARKINWRLRATVLIRDNCICKMCGASPAKSPDVNLHADHVIPYSKGGETVLENLQTLCHVCNIGKSNAL
jgi:hypothetical protein